jgi:hypothetical protein
MYAFRVLNPEDLGDLKKARNMVYIRALAIANETPRVI